MGNHMDLNVSRTPTHVSGVWVTICPSPDNGHWCPEASGGGAVATSLGVWVTICLLRTSVVGVRRRARETVACSLGVWDTICPLRKSAVGVQRRAGAAVVTSLGVWACGLPSAPLWTRVVGARRRAASGSGRRHQSWGLGYHLPLSGQRVSFAEHFVIILVTFGVGVVTLKSDAVSRAPPLLPPHTPTNRTC